MTSRGTIAALQPRDSALVHVRTRFSAQPRGERMAPAAGTWTVQCIRGLRESCRVLLASPSDAMSSYQNVQANSRPHSQARKRARHQVSALSSSIGQPSFTSAPSSSTRIQSDGTAEGSETRGYPVHLQEWSWSVEKRGQSEFSSLAQSPVDRSSHHKAR